MLDTVLKGTYLTGFVAGGLIRIYYSLQYPQQQMDSPRSEKLLLGLQLVGMQIVPLVYVFTHKLDHANIHLSRSAKVATGTAGAIVFAEALWLLQRAHDDLDHYWTVELDTQAGQRLVTEGSYRRIRHPMYAAHWLWAIAQVLLLHNRIAGPAMLATFLPFYLQRVWSEEELMVALFGDVYREYMQRTGRVLPRLP